MQAIESDNQRMEMEVRAREIAATMLQINERAVQDALKKEQAAVRALNIAKLHADAENQALRQKEDFIRAEALETVALRKQINEAKQAHEQAMQRAKNMARLHFNEATKATRLEQERLHAEATATIAARKKSALAEAAIKAAEERNRLEIQMAKQIQYRLDYEQTLAAKLQQQAALMTEAATTMPAKPR
ncbi:MAG: hypothetical protein COZ20_02385 [Gallionellales bacterium CG_4_10_14_3_um_filter_54_96]|nr:MAG: hypothetical protein COZ20_02385 [Gallionellales bacterium CG_4_10_14_3_um_filter_54_96]